MCRFIKKYRWIILGCAVLVTVLVLSDWIFGWSRGDIHVMAFSAEEVDHMELSCTDTHVCLHRVVLTEKDDIQALINSVNSFQHTGSSVKEIFKHGIGIGGTVLYEFNVYLLNGDICSLSFGINDGTQEASDTEVIYSIQQPNTMEIFPSTCKGSMDFIYGLFGCN